jgi:hypothetical protein
MYALAIHPPHVIQGRWPAHQNRLSLRRCAGVLKPSRLARPSQTSHYRLVSRHPWLLQPGRKQAPDSHPIVKSKLNSCLLNNWRASIRSLFFLVLTPHHVPLAQVCMQNCSGSPPTCPRLGVLVHARLAARPGGPSTAAVAQVRTRHHNARGMEERTTTSIFNKIVRLIKRKRTQPVISHQLGPNAGDRTKRPQRCIFDINRPFFLACPSS